MNKENQAQPNAVVKEGSQQPATKATWEKPVLYQEDWIKTLGGPTVKQQENSQFKLS